MFAMNFIYFTSGQYLLKENVFPHFVQQTHTRILKLTLVKGKIVNGKLSNRNDNGMAKTRERQKKKNNISNKCNFVEDNDKYLTTYS